MTLQIPSLLYLLPFAFFFLDIISFAFFEQQIVQALLCFYIVELLQCNQLILLFITSGMLLIEAFVMTGCFMPMIAATVPLIILGILMHHLLYRSWYQKYLLLIGTLLAQSFLINPHYFHTNTPTCLLFKLFVNIVIITFFH